MIDSLLPLPKDDGRDFRVGALYTLPSLDEIPSEYEFYIPEEWYETQTDDTCAKESSQQIVAYQKNKRMDGLFTWVLARAREGYDVDAFGIDLRSMLMAWVKFGGLAHAESPYHTDTPREIYADITKWDTKKLLDIAILNKAGSSIMITPAQGSDLFDSIRRTCWKFQSPAVFGMRWNFDVMNPNIENWSEYGQGHAVLLKGWKNGKFECVILNSYGEIVGDKGKFYATRDMVNHDAEIFGAGILTPESAEKLKYFRDNGFKADAMTMKQIVKPFYDAIFKLIPELIRAMFSKVEVGAVPSKWLLPAIIWQESNGDDNAIGDAGNAYGALQIWQSYMKDVYPFRTAKECLNNRALSVATFDGYMKRYATEKRIGKPVTDEIIARIHNGGPNGHNKQATLIYWWAVKKKMELLATGKVEPKLLEKIMKIT